MVKSEDIRNLLEENRKVLLKDNPDNGICYDGIVDEKCYEEQKIKVAVLLKETNGNDATGKLPEKLNDWDYVGWIKHQQVLNEKEERVNRKGEKYTEENVFYPSTYKKLCHWLCMMFDIIEGNETSYEKYLKNGSVDIDTVRKVLDKVSVLNIKKTWGREKTDANELWKYATEKDNAKVLKQQINMLEANIVLCCSPMVFDIAKEIYKDIHCGKQEYFYKKASDVIEGKQSEIMLIENTTYVSFYHPQGYSKTEEVFANYAIETFKWAVGILKEKGIM